MSANRRGWGSGNLKSSCRRAWPAFAVAALLGVLLLEPWVPAVTAQAPAANDPNAQIKQDFERIQKQVEQLLGAERKPSKVRVGGTNLVLEWGENDPLKPNTKYLSATLSLVSSEASAKTLHGEVGLEEGEIGKPRKALLSTVARGEGVDMTLDRKAFYAGGTAVGLYYNRRSLGGWGWYRLTVRISKAGAVEADGPKRKARATELATECAAEVKKLLPELIDIIEGGRVTDENYQTWFVQTRKLHAELNRATAGTLVSLTHLAASTEILRQQARFLNREMRSLDGRLDPDRPPAAGGFRRPLIEGARNTDAANKRHTQLVRMVAGRRERIADNRQLQADLIAALDRGWGELETKLRARLDKKEDGPERRKVIEPWLGSVRTARTHILEQLELVAYQDKDNSPDLARQHALDRDELVRQADAQARTDGGFGRADGIRQLLELGADKEALVAARAFVRELKDRPNAEVLRIAAQESLCEAEIQILQKIGARLDNDRSLVDRLNAEWGDGVINLETGEWQWPDRVSGASVLASMRGLLATHYEEWAKGRVQKGESTEQHLGIKLLIHLRQRGVVLGDARGEAGRILKHLPPEVVGNSDPPGRAEMLAAALEAALKNPDVEKLVSGEVPDPDARESYFDVALFRAPFMHAAGRAGEWLAKQALEKIIIPRALSLASNLLIQVPHFGELVEIVGKYSAKGVKRAAEWLNRYNAALKAIPGSAGDAIRFAEPYVRNYVVNRLEQGLERALRGGDYQAQGARSVLVDILLKRYRELKKVTKGKIDEALEQLQKEKRQTNALVRVNRLDLRTTQRDKELRETADEIARIQKELAALGPVVRAGTDPTELASRINKLLNRTDESIKRLDESEKNTGLVVRSGVAAALIGQADANPGNLAISDRLNLSRDSLRWLKNWIQLAASQPGGKLLPEQIQEAIGQLEKYAEADQILESVTKQELATSAEAAEVFAALYYAYLRTRTPSQEIRDMVNETSKPSIEHPDVDEALPDEVVTKPYHADHIVSMKRIWEMEGFRELSTPNQVNVLNNRENFVRLSEAANTSKGPNSFRDWTEHKELKKKVKPDFRNKMIQREQELLPRLEKQIRDLLAAERTATPKDR